MHGHPFHPACEIYLPQSSLWNQPVSKTLDLHGHLFHPACANHLPQSSLWNQSTFKPSSADAGHLFYPPVQVPCWSTPVLRPHPWMPVLSKPLYERPHSWMPVLSKPVYERPHSWMSVLSKPLYERPHSWMAVLSKPLYRRPHSRTPVLLCINSVIKTLLLRFQGLSVVFCFSLCKTLDRSHPCEGSPHFRFQGRIPGLLF